MLGLLRREKRERERRKKDECGCANEKEKGGTEKSLRALL